MSLLTVDDLRDLAEAGREPCVSIYIPTHEGGRDVRQDPIRFKNALAVAEERLGQSMRRPDAAALLAPAHQLVRDDAFWRLQSEGLAVFLDSELLRVYRLPEPFREAVFVGRRFHLKPLMPLLSGDGRFYVLALSQQQVRIFEASRHSIRELGSSDIPQKLQDVVGYDFEQRSVQFHTRAPGRGPRGQRDALFFGHGGGDQRLASEEVERFLEVVDGALLQLLDDRQPPLVVAAVERQIATFHHISGYGNLVPGGISGNPDDARPQELHDAAWKLVAPRFQQERERAVERYRELAGTGLCGNHTSEVVHAAIQGRVATLFATTERPLWGRYLPDEARVVLEAGPGDDGAEDLADRAALATLLQGGTVYVVPEAEIPDEGPLAAIYRHP